MSIRTGEREIRVGVRLPGRAGGGGWRPGGSRVEDATLALVGSLVRRGHLDVSFASGRTRSFGSGPGPRADVVVVAPGVVPALLSRGGIGLGESWIRGEWDTSDLAALLEVAARSRDAWLESWPARAVQGAARAARRARGSHHAQERRSRRIRSLGAVPSMPAHYNLGNAFYQVWLDPTMTYSSALFDDPGASLEQAQRAKYERMARVAGIRPGERVLEIGSGWGGFAVFAAHELGCHVTTITIAREQHAYVAGLVREQGLERRIDARLQDYRAVAGRFDRIISIEMIESIDEAQWPTYFARLHELVVPGGTIGLQSIVIDDLHWSSYRRHEDFIRTYVFPNSIVPAPSVLRSLAAGAHLRWDAERDFGPSYARTLAEWHRRFEAAWPDVASLGFDERFRRMWRFYLSYCEAGFRTGRLGVRQIVLSRGG